MQRINRFIAANGIWIFLCAVVYKLTFYIINLVDAFKYTAGSGVRSLFSGLIGGAWDLIILAVILEVSRKVASSYAPRPVQNNPYNAPMPNQQPRPAQPQPQPQGGAAWFCANCGTQNNGGMSFCSKCGKPK